MRRLVLFVGAMLCLALLLVLPTVFPSATVGTPTPVKTAKHRATYMSPSDLKKWLDALTKGGKRKFYDVLQDDDGQNWAFPHTNDMANSRININGAALAVPWIDNDRLQDPDEYAPLDPGVLPPGRSMRSYVSDYGDVPGYGHVVVVFQFAGTGLSKPEDPTVFNFHQIVVETSNPANVLYWGSDNVNP